MEPAERGQPGRPTKRAAVQTLGNPGGRPGKQSVAAADVGPHDPIPSALDVQNEK